MANTDPSIIVPFATGRSMSNGTAATYYTTTYTPSNQSNSTQVLTLAFGAAGPANLGIGYDILTGEATTYVNSLVFADSANIGSTYSFIVATDISLVNIQAEIYVVSNYNNTAYTTSPYVALAVSPPGSDTFKVLPETITTIATQNSYTINTVLYNSKENIEVSIEKGSRVLIIGGHTNDSASTQSTTTAFRFSGGLAFW